MLVVTVDKLEIALRISNYLQSEGCDETGAVLL